MKKKNRIAALSALLLGSILLAGGCSGEQEEKGAVERASDKVAGKAVEYINKPLDKAKQSQAVQNAQNQKMEDMLQESKD